MIESTVKPQEDVVKVIIKKDNQTFGGASSTLNVLSSLPEFKKDVATTKAFLKSVDEITVTNDGNIKVSQTFKVPITFLKRLFTSTEPKARIVKENGKSYLGWDVDLNPGGSTRVLVKKNYRTFSLMLVLIIAIVISYYALRPSLKVKKIAIKPVSKEGGIKELNILLKVINRRNKELQEVKVEDSIPKISELVKEEYLGTLAPSSVFKHETKGTVLRWDIGNLEPKEERLLRYRSKSKLSILGAFDLPKVKVKYKEEGKAVVVYSSKVKVVG